MNKRDVFLPSVSTLTILGMMVFYSCAHQSRVEDELDASSDEDTVVEKAENEVKDTSETVTETVSENTETASNDLDMAQMGLDESGQSAENKVEETKKEVENSLETSTEKLDSNDLSMLGMDSDPAATSSTSESKNELPSSDPLADLGNSATTETLTEEKLQSSKPIIDDPILSKPSSPRKSFAGGAFKVPKIPSKPPVRSGTTLNRFYFLRKGDTPESVSEMIYGSDNHASDLKKWNPGTGWSPGRIVYYSSPSNPKDSQIGSFYRESGVEAEEYTVEKGDWISKIAFKKLGSPESWREVAVINGMSRPDKIEIGQRIAIYPKDLSKFSGGGEESLASNQQMQRPSEMQPVTPPPQFAQVQPPPPPVQQLPPPQIPDEVQRAAEQAAQQVEAPRPIPKPKPVVDSSKLVEQNLPAAVILAGVLILTAAYLAVRRRKMAKQQTEEFDEMPSSKSNRR